MDFITACYYSRMRPYRDRPDISVPGRWRWCPEGARIIPYRHLFGSFTMDWGETRINPPVGEIPAKNGRTRGESSPRYTGQHWCGSQEAWERGILYADAHPVTVDAEGVPLCCQAPPLGPGGLVIDGDADQHGTGGGGGEVGGSAAHTPEQQLHPGGGAEVGGGADHLMDTVYYADGGLEVDGVARVMTTEYLSGRTPSDLEIGGDGSRPLETVIYMEGGVELDADGSRPLETIIRITGGLEVGESGATPFAAGERATGGLEVGESGATPFAAGERATGGLEVGADAGDADAPIVTPCCPLGIPRVVWARFHPGFEIGGPPFVVRLTFDGPSQTWLGSVSLGAPCGMMHVQWTCLGVDAHGMHLLVSIPGGGYLVTGFPLEGQAFCDLGSWVYQFAAGAPVCSSTLNDEYRVDVLTEEPGP